MSEETGLVKVEEFKELISLAPKVLEENRISKSKAIDKANELTALAKEKMDDVIDGQLVVFIDKAKKTIATMNDKRKPFTQIMTQIAKEFTTLEADIKPSIDLCQKFRDDYATQKMEARKEQERLAALKLAKENELIELKKYFTVGHASMYADFLLNFKTKKLEWFNSLTLETISGAREVIIGFDNNLSDSMFNFNVPEPKFTLVERSEYYELIRGAVMSSCYACMAQFKTDIQAFIREMIDMVPSKKQQLEEIEAARLEDIRKKEEEAERQRIANELAAEAKRKAEAEEDLKKKAELEKQAKDAELKAELERQANEAAEEKRKQDAIIEAQKELERQEEEKKKLEVESEQARIAAEAEAQVKASGQRAGAMVDAQADLFSQAPKVKEGYSIQISNQAAYLLLAQFWFEKEGKSLSIDKIESMTFARIKVFCEKYATKNEEFIESGLIKYEPVYKAR